MKIISEKKWSHAPNAMGQYVHSACQTFEIEPSDVGQARQNWRGHGYAYYTFQYSDVGRKIQVYTDHSVWTCWVFA